jgi:chemotaxis protein MotB
MQKGLNMRKEYRAEERENHERWLVSYADFITLLLAVFAVMYAISQVNEGKYRKMTNSLITAFAKEAERRTPLIVAPDPLPQRIETPPAPTPSPEASVDSRSEKARRFAEAKLRQHEKLQRIARDIVAAFAPLVEDGQVRVMQNERGVRVEINANVLFSSGEAALHEESSKALKAVAQVLQNGDQAIQVEGHTDTKPITTPRFPTNWELSAVRATSVVRLLVDNGVAASRLTAVGYGENHPVESNDTEEGRARNRRVTLMILSALPDAHSVLPEEDSTENAQEAGEPVLPEAGASSGTFPGIRPGDLQVPGTGSV